jgi:hypothetical protein
MHNVRDKNTNQYLDDDLSQVLLAAITDMTSAAERVEKPSPERISADEIANSAVNRLFRLMSDHNLDYVELPDGRVVTPYRFTQRQTFLGINVYSQESVVNAYIAHDEGKPVKETYS